MSVLARTSLQLPAKAESTARGRQFVVTTLQQWQLETLVDAAALLTSEVVTNAVLHARSEVTVTVERVSDDCVQIAVSDGSSFLPARRQPSADATNGRGLDLLERLAASWSVHPLQTGKTVQFTLDAQQDPWAGFHRDDWLEADL